MSHQRLHVFEVVDPSLRVALPHLPQGLVLVPALLHVLLVDLVHRRLSLEKKQKIEEVQTCNSKLGSVPGRPWCEQGPPSNFSTGSEDVRSSRQG